jgi:hypothetical protein
VKYNPKERLRIGEVFQHPWMLGKKLRLTLWDVNYCYTVTNGYNFAWSLRFILQLS